MDIATELKLFWSRQAPMCFFRKSTRSYWMVVRVSQRIFVLRLGVLLLVHSTVLPRMKDVLVERRTQSGNKSDIGSCDNVAVAIAELSRITMGDVGWRL